MHAKTFTVLFGNATVGATGTVIGGSPVAVTVTVPVTVTIAEPVVTAAAAPLVPDGQGIGVMVGRVTVTAGVVAVAFTVSFTVCAGGVATHFETPGAETHADTGTDGMVTGPIVELTEVSANDVPLNAMQQPMTPATTVSARKLRIPITSRFKGLPTCAYDDIRAIGE